MLLDEPLRKSGQVWRSACDTTHSEGRFLGRGGADVGVKFKPGHTRKLTARYWSNPWATEAQLGCVARRRRACGGCAPAVGFGLARTNCLPLPAVDGGHVLHPEVISVSPHRCEMVPA